MKTATKVLSIIGAVCAFLGAVGFVICSILFLTFAGPYWTPYIVNMLKEGDIYSSLPGTPEEQAAAIQIIFLVTGISFIPGALVSVAGGILALVNANRLNFIIAVLTIVFGVLTGNMFLLVAGVLAIIAPKLHPEKNENNNNNQETNN